MFKCEQYARKKILYKLLKHSLYLYKDYKKNYVKL